MELFYFNFGQVISAGLALLLSVSGLANRAARHLQELISK
jgi:hypothetical protein